MIQRHTRAALNAFEAGDGKVLTTVWVEADTGQKTFANSIFDLANGQILRAEEYRAEPYEAPAWRKHWVDLY